MLADMHQQPMKTGAWWEYLIPGWNAYALGRDLLTEPDDTARDQLAQTAADALASGVCDPASVNFDVDICGQISNKDVSAPPTYGETAAEHYARDTTGGGRCELIDFPCHAGMRTINGEWISPMDWPLGAKIGAGIAAAALLGFTVGLVRNIAGLWSGK